MDLNIIHAGIAYKNGVAYLKEVGGYLTSFIKLEFQINKNNEYQDNDFELQLSEQDFKKYQIVINDYIYIENSEWGGCVKKIRHNNNIVFISGPNLKLTLNNTIVVPNFNHNLNYIEDYLELKDIEINNALKTLKLSSPFEQNTNIFEFDKTNTKKFFTGTFRFEKFLDAANKILYQNNQRLVVKVSNKKILISTKETKKAKEKINNDYDVSIDSSIDYHNNINFMIGLGKGDLHLRQVLYLEFDEDGNYKELSTANKVIVNSNNDTYLFDYKNAESLSDLKNKMIEKYQELKAKKTISVSLDKNIDIDLCDFIYAKDEITEIEATKQIISKTLTIENRSAIINYVVGD